MNVQIIHCYKRKMSDSFTFHNIYRKLRVFFFLIFKLYKNEIKCGVLTATIHCYKRKTSDTSSCKFHNIYRKLSVFFLNFQFIKMQLCDVRACVRMYACEKTVQMIHCYQRKMSDSLHFTKYTEN